MYLTRSGGKVLSLNYSLLDNEILRSKIVCKIILLKKVLFLKSVFAACQKYFLVDLYTNVPGLEVLHLVSINALLYC